uniref:Leucine-rich repeat-containing N-terminal plant-type domain-containing protein n=1 Tax=Chenopodium quinoa TaxID=63459 RepID=A0A803KT60_CHEQI
MTLEESMGWNQSTDCCQWTGVTCDNSTGRVIGLSLTNKDISGSQSYLCKALYLSFSRNNLHGSIPTSLCNATNLDILNLEYNHFGGIIPDCFTALTQLSVLNLRGNQLHGEIPAKFKEGCSLESLELNENFLEGRIPRSLAHCKALKVLDLGNNQLNDTFPCHLNNSSNLQVLILHSNKLHGTIVCPQSHSIWPLLQIMDVSSNHFIGELKAQSLFNWTLMMAGVTKEKSKPGFLQTSYEYYQNSISLVFKGNFYQLQYILTIFTSMDLSNNAFHGELPEEMGNLNALVVLNLSYNSFSGHIPSSFGNWSQIESLDLSWNNLSGKIPAQLANLNFLEYLDLSFNKLSGKIPTGPQLQTFKASSYEGNQGLYGPPLTAKDPIVTPPTSSKGSNWSSKSEQEWMLRGAEVGFPVGINVFVGPILYIKSHEPIEGTNKTPFKCIAGNELTPAQRKELKKRFGGPKVYKPSPELSKPTEEEPFRRSPRLKDIVIHDREAEERLPRAEKVNANTHKGKGKLTAADKGKAKVGDGTGNFANLVRKIKERVRSLRDESDVFSDEDGDTESSDSELSDFELEVDEGEEDLYSDDDEQWLKKKLDHINSEVKGSLRGVTEGGDQSDDEDTGFDIERNLQKIEAALKLPQYQPPITAQAGSSNAAPATAVSSQPATRTEPFPTQPVTRSNRSLSQPTRVPTTTPPKVKIQTRSKLHVMTSKKDKDLNKM